MSETKAVTVLIEEEEENSHALNLCVTGCASPQLARRPRSKRRKEDHPGKSNEFVDFVDAGKLPLKVIPLLSGVGVRVLWSKSIDDIDFLFFAPLFLKGLRISEDPYRTIAEEGLFQLLESGDDRIIGVVSHLVQGMVSNINTRERMCCIATVRVLQELIVSHPEAVERISEHFKSLLPALDFLNRKASWGTRIRNLVQEAIEMMDILGSEESRLKIRCVLPSYKGLVWDNAE